MEKIVSTMFKCGAIFASINVVFGGGEEGTQASLGEKGNGMFVLPFTLKPSSPETSTSAKDSGDPSSDSENLEQFQSPQKRVKTCEGTQVDKSQNAKQGVTPVKRVRPHQNLEPYAPPAKRVRCAVCESKEEEISFKDLLSSIPKEADNVTTLMMFRDVVEKIHALRNNAINLHPDNLLVRVSAKNEILNVGIRCIFIPSGETYQLMQYNQPRRAVACLLVYTMCPELRADFLADRIRIKNGCFLRLSHDNIEEPLDNFNFYIGAARALLNLDITLNDLIVFLQNKDTYASVLQTLQDSINQPDFTKREQARLALKGLEEQYVPEFVNIVKYIASSLFVTSKLLGFAEAGKARAYLLISKYYPNGAKALLENIEKRIKVSYVAKKIVLSVPEELERQVRTLGKVLPQGYNYAGSLDDLPLEDLSERDRLLLLYTIAKEMHALKGEFSKNYSLYPQDIHIGIDPEGEIAFVEFDKTAPNLQGETYKILQVMGKVSNEPDERDGLNKSAQQAFACLMVYVMVPEFRLWFKSNYVDVNCRCFVVRNPCGFDCYNRLPFDSLYIKLANLIIQGKRDILETLKELVDNPNTLEDIVYERTYSMWPLLGM